MNYKEFTISDLGEFEKVFNQIVKEYKLEGKKDQIFDHLKDVLFDKIKMTDLALIFGKELNLDFAAYSGLAFKLKKEIIDKKFEMDAFRQEISDQYWTKDNPHIIAKEIEKKLDLKFDTQPHQHRFYQAVLSWIKGIRDDAELKDIFLKAFKVGGLEMKEEVADEVINQLEAKKEEITKQEIDLAKIIMEKESEAGKDSMEEPEIKDIDIDSGPIKKKFQPQESLTGDDITIDKLLQVKDIDHKKIVKAKQESDSLADKIEAKEEFLESREELAPPAPDLSVKDTKPEGKLTAADFNNFEFETDAKQEKEVAEQKTEPQKDEFKSKEAEILAHIKSEKDLPEPQLPKKKEMPTPEPQPQVIKSQTPPLKPQVKQPLINKQTPPANQRPKMDDVKFSPQLYGPIEELASFKITDLRRLSKDPNEAIGKIIGKLDLLEDESISKRVEGIKALKMSPLYKMYSQIMNKAINEGKPFADIVEQDKNMNLEEFKAIMALNKQMQY